MCRPSEALEEIARCPVDLLETIIEYRAFAQAWATYQRTPFDELPAGDVYLDLAKEIDFARAGERLKARRRQAAPGDDHD